MEKKEKDNSRPPEPPETSRKIQFHLVQLIGIPLILIIPVLALFGVFGESEEKVGAANSEFEMQVEYPSRFRYKQINPLEVSLRNISSNKIPVLTVAFDRSYISEFSETQFTPDVKDVTGTNYKVELRDIEPGETRRVSVSLQGEHYGLHKGAVTALAENGSKAEVKVSTFIFP